MQPNKQIFIFKKRLKGRGNKTVSLGGRRATCLLGGEELVTVLANNPSLSLVSPSVKLEIMIGAIVICNNIMHSVIMDAICTLIITPIIIIIIPIGVEVVQAHSETSLSLIRLTHTNHHHKEENKYKSFIFPGTSQLPTPPWEYSGLSSLHAYSPLPF